MAPAPGIAERRTSTGITMRCNGPCRARHDVIDMVMVEKTTHNIHGQREVIAAALCMPCTKLVFE